MIAHRIRVWLYYANLNRWQRQKEADSPANQRAIDISVSNLLLHNDRPGNQKLNCRSTRTHGPLGHAHTIHQSKKPYWKTFASQQASFSQSLQEMAQCFIDGKRHGVVPYPCTLSGWLEWCLYESNQPQEVFLPIYSVGCEVLPGYNGAFHVCIHIDWVITYHWDRTSIHYQSWPLKSLDGRSAIVSATHLGKPDSFENMILSTLSFIHPIRSAADWIYKARTWGRK